MRHLAPSVLCLSFAIAAGGCKKTEPAATGTAPGSGAPATPGSAAGKLVELDTSLGKIRLELFRDKAPATTENFLQYVSAKHYDGTIFHRVIDGFMIQGGGFDPTFRERPTRAPVKNEADNGLKNVRGTVAMARTPDPHSATAQFFINVKDNASLDHRDKTDGGWGYCVFGKVVAGLEVVDKIKAVQTGAKGPFQTDAPQIDVTINGAKVVE
ncbi:MAG: peptidyl-prolyl cis-trans isomerase [Deltaproteobacteria bacterium]|nr:peptidyl-prolyl cis-trans isomerase [Deltaproteobacteria bacterium]